MELADGSTIQETIPNGGIHPRLLYHRHFMLTEFLNFAPDDWHRTYARHLCRKYQAKSVTLSRTTRALPTMEDIRNGGTLTDAERYLETPLEWLPVVHAAALIVLVLFTIGLFSRITSILSFLILLNYVHRVPAALFGLDQINAILTLYLAVGPSGAGLSVDRILARYRLARKSLASNPAVTSDLDPPASVGANISLRLSVLGTVLLRFGLVPAHAASRAGRRRIRPHRHRVVHGHADIWPDHASRQLRVRIPAPRARTRHSRCFWKAAARACIRRSLRPVPASGQLGQGV